MQRARGRETEAVAALARDSRALKRQRLQRLQRQREVRGAAARHDTMGMSTGMGGRGAVRAL